MKTVLIVSPHFPPVNAPDMHRVRMSLPYLERFGWRPVVLTFRPEDSESPVVEPLLLESLPEDLAVHREGALPAAWTRPFGIGNLVLRGAVALHRAGLELIRRERPDLVYFSTTQFASFPLGRLWKQRLGIPFVLDYQDPWRYDDDDAGREKVPLKRRLARRLHGTLEPWTLRKVDGLIAVSPDYIRTLGRRYPWVADRPARVLPFGGEPRDMGVVDRHPQENPFFGRSARRFNGVYVGRAGSDMAPSLEVLFRATRSGLERRPELFSRVRLFFIGTDYARPEAARRTVRPVADRFGLGSMVEEHTDRIPYFQALQVLHDADFVVACGSDDPRYTASKIYPYILARRPLLAIFHENSSVVDVVSATRAGEIVPFRPDEIATAAADASVRWERLLDALPFEPDVDWSAFQPYTAEEMTRRQCELFDEVLAS